MILLIIFLGLILYILFFGGLFMYQKIRGYKPRKYYAYEQAAREDQLHTLPPLWQWLQDKNGRWYRWTHISKYGSVEVQGTKMLPETIHRKNRKRWLK